MMASPSPPFRFTHSHAAYPALFPPPSTTVLYALLDMVATSLARPTRGALPALKMSDDVPLKKELVFSVGARLCIWKHQATQAEFGDARSVAALKLGTALHLAWPSPLVVCTKVALEWEGTSLIVRVSSSCRGLFILQQQTRSKRRARRLL